MAGLLTVLQQATRAAFSAVQDLQVNCVWHKEAPSPEYDPVEGVLPPVPTLASFAAIYDAFSINAKGNVAIEAGDFKLFIQAVDFTDLPRPGEVIYVTLPGYIVPRRSVVKDLMPGPVVHTLHMGSS